MAAPSYSLANYFNSGEPAADLIASIEARLTDAGWTFIEQTTFTQSGTSRLMRVWLNPASLNAAGVDFYIGLVRNTATGQGYIAVRVFEGWNTTTKTIQRPTFGTLTSFPYMSGITFANSQFMALAVAMGGTSNYSQTAWTSADGLTWTARRLPLSSPWSSVAYGNSTWVAVSGGSPLQGQVVSAASTVAATSADNGVTWTARTLPASQQWSSVVYGSASALFVAVSNTTGTTAASSPDGITWTSRTLPASVQWSSVAYGGGTYVAVTPTAGTVVASSANGTTWTSRTLPTSVALYSVTYGNGTFVAVGANGNVATSPDGTTWTARTIPQASQFNSVTYGNGMFVATAGTGGAQYTAYSTDGATWTLATNQLPNAGYACGLAYGAGIYVSGSQFGTGNQSIYTFTDATTGTNVARGLGPNSPFGPGDFPLANTVTPVAGTNTPTPVFQDAAATLSTSASFDIGILVSKSYLVVAVNTNGTASTVFTCMAGLYAPSYTDSVTANPPLALLSGSLQGGVTRNMRAPADTNGFANLAIGYPESILLGQHTASTKEPVSQSIRGARAAVMTTPFTHAGFASIGGFRGWLYDCVMVAIDNSTLVKVADTVTIGGTTYTALGRMSYALASGTGNAGVFFNTAAGS